MASIDLSIGFIFLFFAVFTLVVPALFFLFSRESSRRRRTAYGALSADFLDSMQGISTLKIFGQSRAWGNTLAERAHQVYRATMGCSPSTSCPAGSAPSVLLRAAPRPWPGERSR